jgi:hypothetical protein
VRPTLFRLEMYPRTATSAAVASSNVRDWRAVVCACEEDEVQHQQYKTDLPGTHKHIRDTEGIRRNRERVHSVVKNQMILMQKRQQRWR